MPPDAHKEQGVVDSAAGGAPGQTAESPQMSVVLVMDLMVCGLLVAGLSIVAQCLQPDLPLIKLFIGLVGGVLCVMWVVLGRRATCFRLGSMMTLMPMACVFLIQAVQSWAACAGGLPNGRIVALLMTLQSVFCVGTLANLAQERNGPRR